MINNLNQNIIQSGNSVRPIISTLIRYNSNLPISNLTSLESNGKGGEGRKNNFIDFLSPVGKQSASSSKGL